MSFLKKALSSVGIGAARVDAVLNTDRARPGDTIGGTVHVRGGNIAQGIAYVGMALVSQYKHEVNNNQVYVSHSLGKTKVRDGFEVGPGETLDFPFTLQVPWETPLTLGSTKVWVQTSLSVSSAVDPTDKDGLRIDPTDGMATVLNAIASLGFSLRKADCEQNRRMGRKVPFIQEFEFMPGGNYARRLSELEVIMAADPGGVQVWIEADLRARGFAGLLLGDLDLNERFTQVYFDQSTLAQGPARVAAELGRAIDQRIN